MAKLLHYRLANWLTAFLVALWPAAAAQACCCAGGPMLTEDGGCRAGCCAAQAESQSCCQWAPSEYAGICCATSDDRDQCGCSHECGYAELPQKQAGALAKSDSPLAAAFSSDGLLVAAWPAASDLTAGFDAAEFPARPKRILYGVWRN